MFTTKTIFNLLDFDVATLTFGGADHPTNVMVEALPSRSTAAGSSPKAPVVLATVPVPALGAATYRVRGTHSAFNPYGGIRVTSVDHLGNPSLNPFIAYLTMASPDGTDPVSGPHCGGTQCRIAYLPAPPTGAQTIKIAITSIDLPQNIEVRNPLPGGFSSTVNVGADHTYVWDSLALGIDVSGTGLIEVTGKGNIPIAVSATVLRATRLFRVYPSRL